MSQLLSVIVPVYNIDAYLDRCLISLTNQTYKNTEIILIDDGSTDNTGKICDNWVAKDKRIQVIHTRNEGLAAARNHGLRTAKGKYIGFADGDDWIDTTMFETLVNALERFNADIAICGFEEIRSDFRIEKVAENNVCYTKEEALRELIRDRSIESYVWNKLFHRKCIPDTPFPALKRMSDIGGLHNFFRKAERIVQVNQSLYHYVRRNNSLVGKDGSLETTIDYCIAQQVRYSDLITESPVIKKEIQSKYFSSVNSVRRVFFQEYTEQNAKNYRENIFKIKNLILPFYSSHLPKQKKILLLIKGDNIIEFLSDPENYDYSDYKKRQQKRILIKKLLSYLHNFKRLR